MAKTTWTPAQLLARRDFLREVGAGTAVLSVPVLASSCATRRAAHAPSPPKPVAAPQQPATHTTYFDDFGVDHGLLDRVLARGLARGGDFAEIYLQHQISNWIGLQDGEVNRAYSTVDLGAGIRVIKGDAQGFAYSEDLTERALLAAAATAATVADGAPVARPRPLAAHAVTSRYAIPVPWVDVALDKKLPILERCDRVARARDPRVIKVNANLSDETRRVLVANSAGLLVQDDQPMAVLSVSCVAAQQGKTETGYSSTSARDGLALFADAEVDRVAREAAEHTTILFEAGAPPVGEVPVVLGPGIPGILLHEAIGHGMEADFNRKGISIYAGRIGKRVAPDAVTIVDAGEGRLRGSINVDDEGSGTEKTVLVERGILRTYLHDRISAQHFAVSPTGSGRRQSFRFPPVPRMRNTYMVGGARKPAEIIASVERGLYAEVFYNGQVFIGAGDFTFYLKHGRLIEKGKLTRVVKDANLIGNGPKVLEQVALVGDDLAFYSGAGYCGKDGQMVPVGFGLPTIKVGGISVGGRSA